MTKLVILGRKSQTGNYETFFSKLPARTVTTLVPGEVTSCDALILPGGGDITPAFFGEKTKVPVLLTPNWTSCNFRPLTQPLPPGSP